MEMNDAHIYCRKDQIKQEFRAVLELTMKYLGIFGFTDYSFRLSKWSPEHIEKYIDQPENWKYAEGVLREILTEMKVKFVEAEDEAAFYGPKVDVQVKSVVGREESMSTVQLDFLAKERFGLKYVDNTGLENNDVFVIHRAPLSTHERFMAFLIEHYAGVFPVWLSPVQVAVLPISEKTMEFSEKVTDELKKTGIRVELNTEADSLGKKIRNAEATKVPYMLILGEKEVESGTVSVRQHGQKDLGSMSIADFVEKVVKENKEKTIN
jgi:threonyl-tRNA synthetase